MHCSGQPTYRWVTCVVEVVLPNQVRELMLGSTPDRSEQRQVNKHRRRKRLE